MAKIYEFPKSEDSPFFESIIEDGYHVFSMDNAKIAGYYPNEFLDYPGVKLADLKIGDTISVRVFFRVGTGDPIQADGGYLDMEVEHIDTDHIFGVILTELPKEFPLGTRDSLEIREDEILYRTEAQEH